ncbi:MAG: GntR family transcriptional regulator [Micrococcales bacterium]|nr:GntR family transcriptional regulator [Micrococcales bacterium]
MTGLRAVLQSAIADALRDEVLALALAPGESVTEASVALRYGCSRPTARGAIDRLVAEGVLRREAHRAARIPVLERADIVELYDARAVVETAALAALARIGAVPPAAVAANRALATAGRDAGFAREDIAFHRSLIGGQPNRRLVRMHDGLMGEIELCIGQVHAHRLLSPSEIAAEHRRVLDAVVAADPELAAARVGEHIRHSRDRILAHYDLTHTDAARPDAAHPDATP